MTSDDVLMLQFRAGSRESFEELFARYRDPAHAFFRRRLETKEAAEDMTQELWIAVMNGAARYQPRAAFRSYLYGICFKLLANHRRQNAKQKLEAVEIAAAEGPSSESGHWVKEGLSKLDATQREMIMLREYEQLSYEEIAELLHIPLNTVRSRLFRARLALKQLLEPASERLTAPGRS